MQVIVDIPELVAKRAEATGIEVGAFVQRLIERAAASDTGDGFGSGLKTPEEAGADIQEMRKDLTLGGVTICELIEDGRRY